MKMFVHPLGKYLAVQNTYTSKKVTRTNVHLFYLLPELNIPYQIVKIDREVHEFYGVQWEPVHDRFSVHTKSKREVKDKNRDYNLG